VPQHVQLIAAIVNTYFLVTQTTIYEYWQCVVRILRFK